MEIYKKEYFYIKKNILIDNLFLCDIIMIREGGFIMKIKKVKKVVDKKAMRSAGGH